MAKKLYFVSGEEYRTAERRTHELLRRLSQRGTSLSPQYLLDLLQGAIEVSEDDPQPSKISSRVMPRLVKGLFSPLEIKIENVRRWNQMRNWGFTENDFANLPAPPPYPKTRLGTVVLVPYLETPLKTYQELVWAMKEEHWVCVNGTHYLFDKLVVCGAAHEPGLKWEVIDMGGGYEWKKLHKNADPHQYPMKFPPRELMPHAGILAEVAHSPYWARSLHGYLGIPAVWVPGYMTVEEYQITRGETQPHHGQHLVIDGYTDDINRSYEAHRKGWQAKHDWLQEGELTRNAVPILMK